MFLLGYTVLTIIWPFALAIETNRKCGNISCELE